MPDYIYLLENRLSADQRNALHQLREVARNAEIILFLTGDAVRDLTSGHAVRELEVAVQGNALKLKKAVQKAGGKLWGEDEVSRSLYVCFPGTVRVDLVSTHRVEYKKPGQPIYHAAGIQDDLRRRDFTANAMAISLNEGSYGLLMDPLNGVADIEARALRLVSNYGFIEDPSLLIRAIRYRTRLGWELDPRTQTRYENAREEKTIEHLSAHARRHELEEIGHEDEGLKVLRALEAEGWMKVLYPAWTSAKADADKLNVLHDLAVELLVQGVHADISAAQMQLLTAKMPPKDVAGLKKSMLRPGFAEEWNSLDALATGFAKVLLAKDKQTPSAMFKLFMSYDPEAVLWLGFTTKDAGIKQRYQNFLKVWPEMRQQIPYALMQEMRIKPELANYKEVVNAIFLQLIDGKLTTPEEMRAFLEPYSPPAPPPQITIKRSRAKRIAEPKVKEAFDEEEAEIEEDVDGMGGDEEDIGLGLPKSSLDLDGEEKEEIEEEEEEEPAPVRRGAGKATAAGKAGKAAPAAPAKAAAAPAKAAAPAPAKAAPAASAKGAPAKAGPVKAAASTTSKPPAAVTPAKPASAAKPAPKLSPKPAAKPAPAKPAATHAPKPAKAPAKAAKPNHTAPTKAAHKPAAKASVKKATLKPASKPAHKSVPKPLARGAQASVKAKTAKPKAKPAPRPAAKAKPHKPAKPVAKKPVRKPAAKASKSAKKR
jgi:tRNA nucleotidyltransferase/poly(A) polymerase